MENAYLQENFDSEKVKFYQMKLFDDTKFLKKWLCLFLLCVCIYELIQTHFIIPKDLVNINQSIGYIKISGYITAFILYYVSIFRFFESKDPKISRIRFILVLLSVILVCCTEGLESYYKTLDRIDSKSSEKWFYGIMRGRNEAWMILLLDNLIPIWYMRLILPVSFWVAQISAYYNKDISNQGVLWNCCSTSLLYLVIIMGMKAYSDWKAFVNRMNIEAWDGVHKLILDKIPDSIAIIDTKLKVLYSNANFVALCNNDVSSLSKKLVNVTKQSMPLISKHTEIFNEQKWENMSFENEDDLSERNKYTSTRNVIDKDSSNLTLTRLLESVLDSQGKRKPQSSSGAYQIYHANQTNDTESPMPLYEIKIGPLLGFGKAILILTDITQHNLAISLQAANRYKDQLLATVSHDLRAPINGGVSLIESSIEHPSVPDYIKERFLIPAQRTCKFLLHLVNDILDYSQINARKLRMSFEEQSLVETLKECYKLIEIQTKEKGIEFSLILSPDLPSRFVTDHNRLSQIIINLLTNAIKFTNQGEVKLIAEVYNESAVKVTVSDTGVGIKEEDLSKLFKNFTRINSGQNYVNNRGVGLGLAIANKLAKILGSHIQRKGIHVSSIYGKGTDFWFYIENMKSEITTIKNLEIINRSQQSIRTPMNSELLSFPGKEEDFMKQNIDEMDDLGCKLSPRSPYLSSCRSQRQSFKLLSPSYSSISIPLIMTGKKQKTSKILVVDDDPLNILAMRSLLSQTKHSIEIAFNGKEAIDKVLQSKNKDKDFDASSLGDSNDAYKYQGHYKLILMDYEMPVMDGITATEILTRMMKNKEIENIPIIGCSGHKEGEKIKEGLKSGMDEVVEKPVQREKLMKILEKYVDREKLSIFSHVNQTHGR